MHHVVSYIGSDKPVGGTTMALPAVKIKKQISSIVVYDKGERRKGYRILEVANLVGKKFRQDARPAEHDEIWRCAHAQLHNS
jgi:hypothetical protein